MKCERMICYDLRYHGCVMGFVGFVGFFPSINQIELFCIYTDMGRVGFFNAF